MKTSLRFLAAALVFVSTGSSAEWSKVDQFEDNTTIYVDRQTAHRNGDVAEVLHLVRWGEPQIDPDQPAYLSTVVRTAYDCVNKREKYLASTSYAGAMGNGGKVAADEDEAEMWYSISADSMEEKLWQVACGAK